MTIPTSLSQIDWQEHAEGIAPEATFNAPLPQLHSENTMRLVQYGTSQTGTFRLIRMSENADKIEAQDAPRAAAEALSPAHSPSTDPAAQPTSALNDTNPPILVVEDTPDIAEIIQATLDSMGHKSVYAGNGTQGLALMKIHLPRVILLDIGLPDITGWRMLDHIKEHYAELKSALPAVVVITAYGDPANKLIGKLQNVYSYLVKPVLPDQVERVVDMALKGETPPTSASLL